MRIIFLWTVPLNIQIQLMLWQKLLYESEGKKISSPSSVACAHLVILTPVSLSFFLIGVEGQSVEICNTVDIRGETNREIAMRITSDLNSKDRFFTDLNGYQVGHQYILFILSLTHIHNKVYTVYMQVFVIKQGSIWCWSWRSVGAWQGDLWISNWTGPYVDWLYTKPEYVTKSAQNFSLFIPSKHGFDDIVRSF